MISLDLQINTTKFVKEIDKELRQLPFIMATAINSTNELKQRQIHEHVERVLDIRAAQVRKIAREVVRYGRDNRADSKAGKLEGRIEVLGSTVSAQTPQHRAIAAILLRQDDAGPQTSMALYRAQNGQLTMGGFAIPSDSSGLSRTPTRGMDPKLYPWALGLTEYRAISGGTQFSSQYKGGKRKGGRGFKAGTAYYFVEEGVGIFERTADKKGKTQRAREKVPKKFKRGTALYFGNEHIGALTKAMKGGQYAGLNRQPNNHAGAARGSDDQNSIYRQIWFFKRQIDLPKRVDIFGVFNDGIEDVFAASWDNAHARAMATAR